MIELCNLKQKDRYHFEVKWSDNQMQVFRLSEIQRRCPCIRCEQRQKKEINPEVMAIKLVRVGNYGLKIQFTEGCSQGIYPYALLREIGL